MVGARANLSELLQSRYGIEELARIGVLGIGQGLVFRYRFDDPAAQHNDDAWRDEIHKLQIVPYEDDGKAQLLLQVQQQVDNLRLDRDIERADRLIRDQDLRFGGQGARDANPLALSSGKCRRVGRSRGRGQADLAQQFSYPCGYATARRQAVKPDDLRECIADAHPGIEGSIWVLEDGLDVAPPPSELGSGQLGEILALEDHAPGIGTVEQGDAPCQGGFARAAFTDDADDFGAIESQRGIDQRRPGGAAQVKCSA